MRSESIMRTEKELLWSADLARNVAQAVGPERILGGADVPDPLNAAARSIQGRLKVGSEGNVIRLEFLHPDESLCQPVLDAVVDAYLKLHARIHQPGENSAMLAEEVAQEKLRLQESEADLLELRSQMGGVSLEDAKKTVAAEIEMLRRAILEVEAELASREAMAGATTVSGTQSGAHGDAEGSGSEEESADAAPSVSDVVTYAALAGRLHDLRQREQEYQSRFTPENPLVKSVQRQIAELEQRIQEMVRRHPQLASEPVSAAPPGAVAAMSERESVPSLKARMKVLNRQLEQARAESLRVSDLERTFSDVQLRREIQQSNLRHMATTLEQSRYDSAVDSANRSSIKVLQQPSDPVLNMKETRKKAGLVFAAVAGGGLSLAFLFELFLDPRIKRPSQLAERAKLPVYVTIPAFARRSKSKAANGTDRAMRENGLLPESRSRGEEANSPALNGGARSYYEALRDRLIVYFERVNLRRKPKLVGVAACHGRAGVSSVARGLAATLSETGGGKVLLVDLNCGMNTMRRFEEGSPVVALPELLKQDPEAPRRSDPGDTLLLASFGANQGEHHPIRSRQFDSLIPRLKASDFDFIVFDMPPLTPTSVTFRVAGFLDKMLLVVESERTHMQSMTSAISLLEESNARIALVLNKAREYLPHCLRPPQ